MNPGDEAKDRGCPSGCPGPSFRHVVVQAPPRVSTRHFWLCCPVLPQECGHVPVAFFLGQ